MLFERGDRFFEGGDDVFFHALRDLIDFDRGQALGDLTHVVAHLFDGFGKGDRRAFFVQQQEGLVDFVDDLRFLPAEAGGFDFIVVSRAGPRAPCRGGRCLRRPPFAARAFCGSGRRAA